MINTEFVTRNLTLPPNGRDRIHFVGRSVRITDANLTEFQISIENQGLETVYKGLQINTESSFKYIDILNLSSTEALEVELFISQAGIDDGRLQFSGILDSQVTNWPDNQLVTIDKTAGLNKVGEYAFQITGVATATVLDNTHSGAVLRTIATLSVNTYPNTIFINGAVVIYFRGSITAGYDTYNSQSDLFIPAGRTLTIESTLAQNKTYITYDLI